MEEIVEIVFPLILILVVLFFRLYRNTSRLSSDAEREKRSFRDSPMLYHKTIVELEGDVVHIFRNSLAEIVKRKTVDYIRTKIGSRNHRHRHLHQRFLIHAQDLRGKGTVLVERNLKHGRVEIGRGDKVKVKGEYLHTVSWQSRSPYGRLHKTYAPHGFIEVL
ncbi:MAG: hypothetical protein KDD55_04460 [Bdellovibrionales bacterium]|nr:hypothetical protein [Bdellovibrionales bacterium]